MHLRTEELREANLRLEALATTDALTGLANRRVLQERLEREIQRAARSRKELALVMIDVDHFKRYNDNLGHLAGDDCLRQVAAALRTAASRPADLVARYGGEEFAILLPETPAAQAAVIADTVRQTILKLGLPHPSSPTAPYVTISAGVAGVLPAAGSEPAELIAAADAALYLAKQGGRNRALLSESGAHQTAAVRRLGSAA